MEREAVDPEQMVKGEAAPGMGCGVNMNGTKGSKIGMLAQGGWNPNFYGRLRRIGSESGQRGLSVVIEPPSAFKQSDPMKDDGGDVE